MPEKLSPNEAEREAAALQFSAEGLAAKERRSTESADYEFLDESFDDARKGPDAKSVEQFIDQLGQLQELKTALGQERYDLLSRVGGEILNGLLASPSFKERLSQEMDKRDRGQKIDPQSIVDNELLSKWPDLVRQDPRIQAAFAGLDGLLPDSIEKMAAQMKQTMLAQLELGA